MKRLLKRIAEGTASRLTPLAWRMQRGPRLLVLMYHRVLPPTHVDRAIEQPGMYVSPATLDLHCAVLKRYFDLVHLDDWLRAARARERLPRMACALTFDDGWRDNFEYALPVLEQQRVPATIFLVSSYTGTAREFWPNRLGRLLFAATVQPGSVEFPERLRELIAPVLEDVRRRGTIHNTDVDRAITATKQLREDEIRDLIARSAGPAGTFPGGRDVLNEDEIHEMGRSGLVRFGSHTRTHFRLRGAVPAEILNSEIVESRAEIAASCGQPVNLFCYPNGDLSESAVGIVRHHYLGAVTTEKGWHTPRHDPFLIRRIGVHEDISNRPDSFLARISGWL